MSLLSEIETMDNTLPFTEDIALTNSDKSTLRDTNSKPKIQAPTIEEVDEDPESLRTLRGQGRYFGVDDDDKDGIKEAAPKCSNCSQRGHLKRNCPHVICTYCGAMDDHYSKHCPKAIKCANCNENGHYRSQCPHKWKRVYCTLCNSKRHARDRCPSIWRVYLIKEDKDDKKKSESKKQIPFDKIYCYNCGAQGHFGDDCDQRRSSRVPNDDGSAFSGDNLPAVLKKTYFNYINDVTGSNRPSLYDEYSSGSNRSSNNSYGNTSRNNNNSYANSGRNNNNGYTGRDDFDYDDYELDESYYDDDNSNSGRNSKKRKRSDRNREPSSSSSYNNSNKRNKSYNDNDNYNNRYNNSGNSRNHPLEFPRSARNNTIATNMQNSRYNGSGSSRGRNYNNQSNNKNYNSYKPFRSGTLRR